MKVLYNTIKTKSGSLEYYYPTTKSSSIDRVRPKEPAPLRKDIDLLRKEGLAWIELFRRKLHPARLSFILVRQGIYTISYVPSGGQAQHII